uniref:GNAT family N-acetyltransferase n=1 Tax=Acetatifactor sp. TaxID=1872090 RepID=UPI0040576BD5
MIIYNTLDNISYETLYEAFLYAFEGFRITTEATYDTFCEMLEEHNYNPKLSIGAFDSETGSLVSFVLNSIIINQPKTAYDILTGTLPNYRRLGISRVIFGKVKTLLKENQVDLYTTEVKKNNTAALNLYQSIGFGIKNEVISTIKTTNGTRNVDQYEIIMIL